MADYVELASRFPRYCSVIDATRSYVLLLASSSGLESYIVSPSTMLMNRLWYFTFILFVRPCFRSRRAGIKSIWTKDILLNWRKRRNRPRHVWQSSRRNGRNHTHTIHIHHVRNAPPRSHQDPYSICWRFQDIVTYYEPTSPNARLPATFAPDAHDKLLSPQRPNTLQFSEQRFRCTSREFLGGAGGLEVWVQQSV